MGFLSVIYGGGGGGVICIINMHQHTPERVEALRGGQWRAARGDDRVPLAAPCGRFGFCRCREAEGKRERPHGSRKKEAGEERVRMCTCV